MPVKRKYTSRKKASTKRYATKRSYKRKPVTSYKKTYKRRYTGKCDSDDEDCGVRRRKRVYGRRKTDYSDVSGFIPNEGDGKRTDVSSAVGYPKNPSGFDLVFGDARWDDPDAGPAGPIEAFVGKLEQGFDWMFGPPEKRAWAEYIKQRDNAVGVTGHEFDSPDHFLGIPVDGMVEFNAEFAAMQAAKQNQKALVPYSAVSTGAGTIADAASAIGNAIVEADIGGHVRDGINNAAYLTALYNLRDPISAAGVANAVQLVTTPVLDAIGVGKGRDRPAESLSRALVKHAHKMKVHEKAMAAYHTAFGGDMPVVSPEALPALDVKGKPDPVAPSKKASTTTYPRYNRAGLRA